MLFEMTDLSRLARQAPAGTRLLQFSSYDRASRIEDGEKKDWYANRDIGNYLRPEQTPRGTEWVMAEVPGPGAIVRMWSANAGRRIWRVYLDGGAKPVIEAKGKNLLDGLKGGLPAVFSEKTNFGYNLYLPIPFQSGCKVTVAFPDGKDRETAPLMYYHVDVRTFPAGTTVETFSWEGLKNLKDQLQATSQYLLRPETLPLDLMPAGVLLSGGGRSLASAPENKISISRSLQPHESISLAIPEGTAMIDRLTVTLGGGDSNKLKELLGRTLLEITFDHAEKPQVQSPLGEFFGAGPGVVPYNSLPLMVEQSKDQVKLTSRWVMPYQKGAEIKLTNLAENAANYEVTATVSAWEWQADSLYFHAGYRSRDNIPTRPPSDITLLSAAGPGRYVGTELNVRNHLEHFWWGEGDEKVYVDRESFPSIFGTGTEDYFGYAWCVQFFRFTHAYHGVPKPSRVWLVIPQATSALGLVPWGWVLVDKIAPIKDTTSQYRWHILDDIPYEKSIQFDLELIHHRKTVVDFAWVTFWYAAPGATDDEHPVDLKERKIW